MTPRRPPSPRAAPGEGGGPGDPAGAPRSLADDLRRRSDAELAELLAARPDLTRPPPADLTALAARAATQPSILRAVDALDAGALATLEALAIAGDPVDDAWAGELTGLGQEALHTAVDDLWRRALVWRGADGWHVPRPVAEALGPYPAGLADGPADRADVAAAGAALAGLREDQRAVLERLAWGPPVGAVSTEQGAVRAVVQELIASGLLEARGAGEVLLPRRVALALRGGRSHREVALAPPELGTRPYPVDRVDAAAGAAAGDVLAMVDELAVLWGPAPPRVLRAGGLAVADLRAVADALDLELPRAAFLVELAYAAALVDDDGELEPVWAPTAGYDEWQGAAPERRWLHLARSWLATTRAPSLVGRRRDPRSPAVNALTEASATALGRAVRHDVLALLAGAEPGEAPDADSIVRSLHWGRPRRPATALADLARAALAEAAWLGMTGYGALSGAGRLLVTAAAEEECLAALRLPSEVDHVVLQADLTAVAPGRLEARLAAFLRLAADVESRGGATVYRFTPASLRRPLDAGWDAGQLLDALDGASSTGVPQPLEYLVGDVARRHGGLRVGAATAYVRSDDHVAIDDLVARRDLAAYRLRRLGPGVAVAQAAPTVLLGALRDAGLLPVAEGPEGAVVVPVATHRRARARRGRHATPGLDAGASRAGDAEALAGVVAALRVGEEDLRAAQARREDLSRHPLLELDPARLAAYLRDAAAAERRLWVAVVDAAGTPRRLRLRPERVEGGRVYGETDAGPGRSYSLHRISAVGPAE